ncbi:hypothetical protein CHO01_01850 [Cellulomonas hominis]|uniref:PIN domain-containing protein n=1 Tax=Cellulomonas hominis TaxID=156981 RepID=A0A511F704_9CELL|nr:hypothetical protein [Cellulomonas hominis]MBB5474138.1 hypothetical protein [Cellulomonas hominis]NKY05685.1 hypothetical protein [Cellulomonas hominis]NKY09849.1 hypothetical protein [Cellulomonas hominis]GEL45069.1 hypothetical protein CHO01_01850 [Cellulomonas hominis]
MNEHRYLLDANVLTRLTADQRASAFVSARCRVTAEVMNEVRGLPDRSVIARIELSTDARTLGRLREVMASVVPGDQSLVDLYRNKGCADPVIVAAALAAEDGQDQLWQTQWHIVSDDKAVRAMASTFGISWISRRDLVALIEEGDLARSPSVGDRHDFAAGP